MKAQDLKNSILQLAIQGKLVEQREEEGTAKELLEKIEAEKKQLIREGKIKKQKALPAIKEDEIPFEIPESWEWVRCSDVFNVRSASRIHKTDWKTTGIPFLRGRELVQLSKRDSFDAEIFIDEELYEKFKEKTGIPLKDDLLISAVGTIGKVYIVKETDKFYYKDAYILCFENYGKLYSKYIRYMLESVFLQNQIKKDAMATTVAQLTIIKAKSLVIPLPPLEEQKRIVAKIEELMPYVEKYDAAYSEVEELNKKFPEDMRKSILQYAIQGKLVEQREEEGTAEEFYKQIQEGKKKLIQEGKIKKAKTLPEITEDEIPFEIPESWKWVRLGDVFQIINGDRGKNYPSKDKLTDKGIPFISALNIENHTISEEKLLYMNEEQYNKLGSGKILKGDLILCIRGSLGKNGRYPFENGAIASSLVILRSYVEFETYYSFITKYLNTVLFSSEVMKYNNGTAQPNLSARDLAKFLIPLPQLAEQKRIVEKIEELLPYTNQLVKKVE